MQSLFANSKLILMNSFNKTEATVFSCRLCFLRAFPFISLILLFIVVVDNGVFNAFVLSTLTVFTKVFYVVVFSPTIKIPCILLVRNGYILHVNHIKAVKPTPVNMRNCLMFKFYRSNDLV